jgi:hypothetical protein
MMNFGVVVVDAATGELKTPSSVEGVERLTA